MDPTVAHAEAIDLLIFVGELFGHALEIFAVPFALCSQLGGIITPYFSKRSLL